ncbi:MAG TPA: hypothetical protein DF613_16165 [Lachnospiraceae bacterium]|nr:hypothetical protein [Lachnospiraceae bacterium]
MRREHHLQPYTYLGIAEGFFLLVTSRIPAFCGTSGAIGVALATVCLCVLQRLWGDRQGENNTFESEKNPHNELAAGLMIVWLLAVFAAVLWLLAEITADWVLEGMDWRFALALYLFFLLLGVGRRSAVWRRFVYISWKWLAVIFTGLLLMSARQIDTSYVKLLGQIDARHIAQAMLLYLGLSWYVLMLGNPAGQGKRRWPGGKEWLYLAMGGIQAAFCLLLVVVYGTQGAGYRKWPTVSLLQGLSLPGKFIERLDVLWVAALVFSGLLAMGLILGKVDELLGVLGLPRLSEDARRIKDVAALVILAVTVWIYGYSCVEAQDRAYALAMCVDWQKDGYKVWFLETVPEGGGDSSGGSGGQGESGGSEGGSEGGQKGQGSQGKSDGQVTSENGKSAQDQEECYVGATFREVLYEFARSNEHYLDLGHVKAVVLDDSLLSNRPVARGLFAELAALWRMDENSFVYQSEDVRELAEADLGDSSLGDYLGGIYENQQEQTREPLKLRKLLTSWENGRYDKEIPVVKLQAGRPCLE